MPKKKAAATNAATEPDTSDDPSVIRIPSKPKSPSTNTLVLPTSVLEPVPILPVWNLKEVVETYTTTLNTEDDGTTSEATEESTEQNSTAAVEPFVDNSVDLSQCLPPSMAALPHEWRRPVDVVSLPYWQAEGQEGKSGMTPPPSSAFSVVDLQVPLTEEEISDAAEIQTKHEASVKAAEEAGEEAPALPVAVEKPTPRTILRPLEANNSYSARFVSVFEMVNAVAQSYLVAKVANAPPPPTDEELAAQAEEAAAAKAAAEEAAAAASKKKKGKGAPAEVERTEVEENTTSDPNNPVQDGHFLWECIYPKGPDGILPTYQSNGRYSVKMFVNGDWRRVEVDDRIPINTTTGKPLLPTSTNRFELWPLLLSKALCLVTRGRWSDFDCVSWLTVTTGWQIGDWLKVELPPGDDGVDGREHYSSLVQQTWPRVLPAVPHQIIVYEEDSDSEGDSEGFGDDQGLDDAVGRAEQLLEGAENGAEMKESEEKTEKESSISSLEETKKAFEIHVLCVGEEDVIANGAEKVGAEAAQAALEEALSGGDDVSKPPITLRSNCIYLVTATRGGDDGATHDDLHDGVDEEIVVADDRDISVHVGSVWGSERSQAWLTLDCVIASFADPLTAEKGHMISLSQPLVTMPHVATWEKRWRWSWKEEETVMVMEEGEGEGDSKAVTSPVEGAESTLSPADGRLIVPETKGKWERLPTLFSPPAVLYFPIPEAVEGEEGSAAAEVTGDAAAVIGESTFVACLSNHISYPHASLLPSSTKVELIRMSDRQKFTLETKNVTSMNVPLFINVPTGGDKTSRMYEIVDDAPAGTTLTVMSSEAMQFMDYAEAKAALLGDSLQRLQGSTDASNQGQMTIPFRLHFEIPAPEPVVTEDNEPIEEEKEAAPVPPVSVGVPIDVNLTIHDYDVRPYVKLYLINEDDGNEEEITLLSFTQKTFVPNLKGYTLMAAVCSNDADLPSSSFTLDVLSKVPLSNVMRHTVVEGALDFRGEYYPNKYYRLMRDVIAPGALREGEDELTEPENVEGEIPQAFCPYATLRFKVRALSPPRVVVLRCFLILTYCSSCSAVHFLTLFLLLLACVFLLLHI